jgi:hypothetical protein
MLPNALSLMRMGEAHRIEDLFRLTCDVNAVVLDAHHRIPLIVNLAFYRPLGLCPRSFLVDM